MCFTQFLRVLFLLIVCALSPLVPPLMNLYSSITYVGFIYVLTISISAEINGKQIKINQSIKRKTFFKLVLQLCSTKQSDAHCLLFLTATYCEVH